MRPFGKRSQRRLQQWPDPPSSRRFTRFTRFGGWVLRPIGVAASTLAVAALLPLNAPEPEVWVGQPVDKDVWLANVEPVFFSPEELRELRRRFGVHGPQPQLAQLFSDRIDAFEPLRNHTLNRLEQLRPVILQVSAQHHINPMLVTAILFDEMRHAKPGESHPVAAHSGLFTTHGLAQIGIGELVHQGLISAEPTAEEITWARDQLLDPEQNIRLLVGKFSRLKQQLQLPTDRMLQVSNGPQDVKGLATLAYLHNGKLDYPGRILTSMQDPALHALLFGQRKPALSPLI